MKFQQKKQAKHCEKGLLVVKYCENSKAKINKHTVKEKIKNATMKDNGYLQVVLNKNNNSDHRRHRVAEKYLLEDGELVAGKLHKHIHTGEEKRR